MPKDRLLIVLAGGAVLLGSLGCAVPTRSVEEREWQVPSLRELLPAALDAAIEWRPDAHLVTAMVLGRPEPQVEFIMGSMATPDVGLLVYVDDPMGTPSIRLVEVAAPGRLEARPELELASWGVLDSPEAFQLALASGGSDFLARRPDVVVWRVQMAYLQTPAGGGPVWRVTFGDALETRFDVLIDPDTREILEAVEKP